VCVASQPSLQTIRYRIRADGRVEETVEGLQGDACERLTERIEARLGAVQQRQPTAEAFQVAVQHSDHLEATNTCPLP
jgi:hypothetical protein